MRPRSDPLQELRLVGEHMPDELWDRLVDLGPLAIPHLIELVADESRSHDDSPGGGWPPIHAVDLLAELSAVAAARSLVVRLQGLHPDEILFDRIVSRLPEFGPAVLDLALAALGATEEEILELALCEVLARLGVKDERIWSALVRAFEADAVPTAPLLADYGDGRALELLREELNRTIGSATPLHALEIQVLAAAYDELDSLLPQ
jgi:hypothetical protein